MKSAQWKNLVIAWAFLLIGLAGTALAYWMSKTFIERDSRTQVGVQLKDAALRIQHDLDKHTEALKEVRTQFLLKKEPGHIAFTDIAAALVPPGHHPEIRSMGFIRRAPSLSGPATFPYHIDYLASFAEGGLQADAHHSLPASWLRAIERARNTGELTVTGRAFLLPSAQADDGIVFFMPIYREGWPPAAASDRQAHFVGALFVGVHIAEVIDKAVQATQLSGVPVQAFHFAWQADEDGAWAKELLYTRPSPSLTDRALIPTNANSITTLYTDLQVADTTWQLEAGWHPAFAMANQDWLPWTLALAGCLLSSLSFRYMLTLDRRRRSALERATTAEHHLDSQERSLKRIARMIDDVLWTLDVKDGAVRFVNSAVEEIFGRPAQDFYNRPSLWLQAVLPQDRQRVFKTRRELLAKGNAVFKMRIQRPDGNIRWIRVKAYLLGSDRWGEIQASGIASDVTALTSATDSLRRSNRALHAIHTCDNLILSSSDEQSLLQGICSVIVENGYGLAWIGSSCDGDASTMKIVASAGEAHHYVNQFASHLQDPNVPKPTIMQAIRDRLPAVENHFAQRPTLLRRLALEEGLQSKVALPLLHDGQLMAILNVYAFEEEAFDEEEIKLLFSLTRNVAAAVQGHRERHARQQAETNFRIRHRAIEACANPIAILRLDHAAYPVEYINPAFERITGYTLEDVDGLELRYFCHEECDRSAIRQIRQALEQRREGHAVLKNKRKDGSAIWCDLHVAPVRDETNQVSHFIAVMYDITATKQLEDKLRYQANFDSLTGLANRHLLEERLNDALAKPNDLGSSTWVMMLDLDRFKYINDTLGHHLGDSLLKTVAERLSLCVRRQDTVARLGGDEFVIVLQADEAEVREVAQRIMQQIAKPFALQDKEFVVTGSIGVARYPKDGDDSPTLLKHADMAMYHAKEAGRNALEFYSGEMDAKAMERMQLEAALRKALEREEFELVYQPQVDLRTGRIVGMEALLRWRHPELGTVSPSRFIPIAEETGLILAIGEWTLRTACRQNRQWQERGMPELRVSVNLSPRQFYGTDLVQLVTTVLEESDMDACLLDLELTETVLMKETQHAIDTLQRLKALGVHISVDDFGTEYSSLAYLKRFPLDVLKVDRSFIQNMIANPEDAAITRAIISLAHHLGLKVIAEGVETPEQFRRLQEYGADQMQGYYFSAPIPPAAFETLYHRMARFPWHPCAPAKAVVGL